MIASYKLTCEEPIVANEHLWEIVEETGRVESSQSTINDLQRYTFHWRRNAILDDEDFARWCARGAGVGYSINVDSGDPRAVLVDARQMCASMSKYCSGGSTR